MLGLLDFVKKQQCRIFKIKASVNIGHVESRNAVHLSNVDMMAKGAVIASIFCLPVWGGFDMYIRCTMGGQANKRDARYGWRLKIKRCEELTRVELLPFQRLPGAFFVSGYGILADMC